jgi:GDPmannose 4,6-dehydratase
MRRGIGGFAGDYVEAMWMMLQAESPDDYVVAPARPAPSGVPGGRLRKARHGLGKACRDRPRYFRPSEVDLLLGDSSKIRKSLGWTPKTPFAKLVEMMVDSDLRLAEKESLLKRSGAL